MGGRIQISKSPLLDFYRLFSSLETNLNSVFPVNLFSRLLSKSNSFSFNFNTQYQFYPIYSYLSLILQTLAAGLTRISLSRSSDFNFLNWDRYTSIDTTREILKTHDINFASRPISPAVNILSGGGKGIGFTSYREHWRHVLKICIVGLISNKRVQSLGSIREEEANNLARNISISASCGELINLQKVLTTLANDITVKTVIGSKCKDPDVFLNVLEEMLELASGFSLVDLFPSSRLLRVIN